MPRWQGRVQWQVSRHVRGLIVHSDAYGAPGPVVAQPVEAMLEQARALVYRVARLPAIPAPSVPSPAGVHNVNTNQILSLCVKMQTCVFTRSVHTKNDTAAALL